MRSLLTDIGLTLLLASTIFWFQTQPVPPIALSPINIEDAPIQIPTATIILFWDINIKSSHRDIQLIQRFKQAHPNIETIFIHSKSHSDETLSAFLIDLGVYTTPAYNEAWPNQIPTTILINESSQTSFTHSPHYSALMEFFDVEF